jgi:hypothetical protein
MWSYNLLLFGFANLTHGEGLAFVQVIAPPFFSHAMSTTYFPN